MAINAIANINLGIWGQRGREEDQEVSPKVDIKRVETHG